MTLAQAQLEMVLFDATRVQPDEVLIWSGAGIAVDTPTGGPLGAELTARALRHCFQPETAVLLACYYAALELPRAQPRLETVLDVVNRVQEAHVLVDLLSDLTSAKPNGIHQFLGELSRRGAAQITTNFDSCLEDAGAVDVLHVHGSFASDPSGVSLGATLARIERGLPQQTADGLDQRLRRAQTVVFVGYSGSDFFDVDPYLRQRLSEADLARDKTVVWLSHGALPVNTASAADAAARQRQLAWFSAAGARVHHIHGPTRELLAALGHAWGLSPPALPFGRPRPWVSRAALSPEARRRASLELYALMGLHREVDRLLEMDPPHDQGECNLLAQTRWSQGRYSEALAAWREALDGPSLREREAAVDWVRGRFLRARRRLVQALIVTDSQVGTAEELPLEERIVLAETLALVWQHMRRYPDSRPFASERLRKLALAHLPDPAKLAQVGRPLGTHLTSRVRTARAALGVASEGEWEAIESFSEYEALNASLNYQHARLRADATRGPIPVERYQRLYRDRVTIGGSAAAAATMLLPGAYAAFRLRDVLSALRRLDATPWHRLRVLALELGHRAHARLSLLN